MSKNIGIKEGGLSRLFGPLRKLKTALQAGGFCFWIPKDEITLTTKSITKNGVYNAADDGYSAYSSVTVNVATGDVVTGKGQDGNEYVVKKDGSGKLVEDKVPSKIVVIEPPTNPYGIYQDRQTITKDGMVVKAYYADESEYGIVPLSALSIEPTVAVYDPDTDNSDYTDDNGVLATPYVSASTPLSTDTNFYYVTDGLSVTVPNVHFMITKHDGCIYFASTDENNYIFGISAHFHDGSSSVNVTAGQTFAIGISIDHDWVFHVAESTTDPNGVNRSTLHHLPAGSRQTITVTWGRPGDGKELYATFEIRVAPSPSGNDV